ncbi:hypothetical protein GTY65_34135 [Streptomyces sp. SID8379]|uniref:hypothetical protein n=1 Tax=unclassified Streptomyces TaxID=2593676 RepID=UPI00131A35D9|nr:MULTISPECIES: hypothetical protein [unclassified Streptomyces]MYW69077.1 hypothetical protein [Streptomyces sp. SID8379]
MAEVLQAVSATGERLPRPVQYALQLSLAGVRPANQGEWAAWLHLCAIAQGDQDCASAVEGSGIARPWTVDWHHWRPPGAVQWTDPLPGHIKELRLLPKDWAADGRPTVLGHDGHRDRAYHWVWDVETGELLAGPRRGEVPGPGDSQPMSMARSNAMLGWHPYEPSSHDRPLVTQHLALPERGLTLYAAPGGVFAVRSSASDPLGPACHAPAQPSATPFPVHFASGGDAPQVERHPDYPSFVPSDFHRLRAEDLPESVGEHSSRDALITTGIPAVRLSDLTLHPPRCVPDTSGEGNSLIMIGYLQYGRLVIDGSTGIVYRMPSEFDPSAAEEIDALGLEPFHPDEDPSDPGRTRPDFDLSAMYEDLDDEVDFDEYVAWVAPDLPTFLTLASRYCGVMAHLGSLNSEAEARGIIDVIEFALDDVARTPVDSWWTATLREPM